MESNVPHHPNNHFEPVARGGGLALVKETKSSVPLALPVPLLLDNLLDNTGKASGTLARRSFDAAAFKWNQTSLTTRTIISSQSHVTPTRKAGTLSPGRIIQVD